jgi:hypothetical protein
MQCLHAWPSATHDDDATNNVPFLKVLLVLREREGAVEYLFSLAVIVYIGPKSFPKHRYRS